MGHLRPYDHLPVFICSRHGVHPMADQLWDLPSLSNRLSLITLCLRPLDHLLHHCLYIHEWKSYSLGGTSCNMQLSRLHLRARTRRWNSRQFYHEERRFDAQKVSTRGHPVCTIDAEGSDSDPYLVTTAILFQFWNQRFRVKQGQDRRSQGRWILPWWLEWGHRVDPSNDASLG